MNPLAGYMSSVDRCRLIAKGRTALHSDLCLCPDGVTLQSEWLCTSHVIITRNVSNMATTLDNGEARDQWAATSNHRRTPFNVWVQYMRRNGAEGAPGMSIFAIQFEELDDNTCEDRSVKRARHEDSATYLPAARAGNELD